MPLDLTLSSLAYGGDAIGRTPDGMTVFVPFALPGERVRVEISEQKKGFARARLLEVLTPSAERITPRCLHFTTCGGCQYQHMPYASQTAARQAIFSDQLKRLARLENPRVLPIQPSPLEWNYRNALQFQLSPAGKLGFNEAGSHRVVEIHECHLPLPGIADLWKQIEFEPCLGIRRVELREGSDGSRLMLIDCSAAGLPELDVQADVSVVGRTSSGSQVMAGDDFIRQQVRGRPFTVSAGSFFQVNLPQAEAMVSEVLSLLPLRPPELMMDLYAGSGCSAPPRPPPASGWWRLNPSRLPAGILPSTWMNSTMWNFTMGWRSRSCQRSTCIPMWSSSIRRAPGWLRLSSPR